MSIEKIILSLCSQTDKALSGFSSNAERVLTTNPFDRDATRLLAEVTAEQTCCNPLPVDGWSCGSQGNLRRLMKSGKEVAVVRRFETHTSQNDGVYAVEVLGVVLDETFRYVDDARKAAEKYLRERE